MLPNQLMAQPPSQFIPQTVLQPNPLTAPSQQRALQATAVAQPSLLIPPPQVSHEKLKRSIKTGEMTINGLSKIASNPDLLQDPDKLQKALLAQAADVYKASAGDNKPDELIAHAMDIVKDPRGPATAIKDRIAMILNNMSSVDMYSRNTHGASAIAPSSPSASGDING